MQNNRNPLIFVVEDNPVYNDVVGGILKTNKFNNLRSFKSPEECLKSIHLKPDIIVLNYAYSGFTGLDLMRKIHETQPEVIFIFLSGQNDVETAVRIIRHGAFDYVVKNEKAPARLISAINQAISTDRKAKVKRGLRIGGVMIFVIILILLIILFSLSIFSDQFRLF